MSATTKCITVVFLLTLAAGASAHIPTSNYLYGVQFYGSDLSTVMNGKPAYCVEQYYVTDDDIDGLRQRVLAVHNAGYVPIVRIDWEPGETVPTDMSGGGVNLLVFTGRCGQIANALKDICKIYVIGNEMNAEWEGAIDPGWYLTVFNTFGTYNCYDMIKAYQPDAIVCMGAVAPWNQTVNPGGPYNGSKEAWKNYFRYLINNVGSKVDGFAIHVYGGRWAGNQCSADYDNDPRDDNNLGHENTDPKVDMVFGFNVLQYWMSEIDSKGSTHANKPVYITEANTATSAVPSTSYRHWWMHCAYEAVDCWNRTHYHRVKALCWFVYSYGYGWSDYAIMDRSGMPANLAQARADFEETTRTTAYTPSSSIPYALIWNLHTGYSNPDSSDPNQIVVDTYAGRCDWNGSNHNWGTGGPNGLSNYWILVQNRMFYVPSSGTYNFRTTSDDGSWLWVDGEIVVNNYGRHGVKTVTGSKYLVKGYHWVYVKFFEWTGGAYTGYQVKAPGGSWTTISDSKPPKGNGLVYGLNVGASDLNSQDMNRIVPGTWLGALGWSGYRKDWGSSGPYSSTLDDWVIMKPFMFYVGNSQVYTFRTGSDDGSWLWIDGEIVVYNHGLHSFQWVTGQKHLMPGWHTGFFKMFEHTGGASACFQYQPPCSNGRWDCFFAY